MATSSWGGNTRSYMPCPYLIHSEELFMRKGISCTPRSSLDGDVDQYLYTMLDISLYERSCDCKMLVAYIPAKGESFQFCKAFCSVSQYMICFPLVAYIPAKGESFQFCKAFCLVSQYMIHFPSFFFLLLCFL